MRERVGKEWGRGKQFRVGKPVVKAAWQEVAVWRERPHGGPGLFCLRSLGLSN